MKLSQAPAYLPMTDQIAVTQITSEDAEDYVETRIAFVENCPLAVRGNPEYMRSLPFSKWQGLVDSRAASDQDTTFVAKDGKKMIGYVDLQHQEDQGTHITHLYVVPEWRRHGVATRLIDAATDLTRSLDSLPVYLWVTRSNSDARRFYERNGFVKTDELRPFEPGSRMLQVKYVLK